MDIESCHIKVCAVIGHVAAKQQAERSRTPQPQQTRRRAQVHPARSQSAKLVTAAIFASRRYISRG